MVPLWLYKCPSLIEGETAFHLFSVKCLYPLQYILMCLYHVSWGVPGYVDLLISYDIELHKYIGSLYNTSCYSAMFIIYVLSGYVHILLCIYMCIWVKLRHYYTCDLYRLVAFFDGHPPSSVQIL